MANPSLLQLWQHGTLICRITPTTERPPYWVLIHDGEEPISQRSFDEHNDAIVHAITELRRAIEPPEPGQD